MDSNTEIADNLSVSVNTVKAHLKSLYRKLDVPGRRAAVHPPATPTPSQGFSMATDRDVQDKPRHPAHGRRAARGSALVSLGVDGHRILRPRPRAADNDRSWWLRFHGSGGGLHRHASTPCTAGWMLVRCSHG